MGLSKKYTQTVLGTIPIIIPLSSYFFVVMVIPIGFSQALI